MINSLKIQEPLLLKFHNSIVDLFIHNDIAFEASYHHEPKNKSTVLYSAIDRLGKPRAGFISAAENRFDGAVYRDGYVEYLESEGFTEEQLQKEKVFVVADSVELFFSLLLFKNLSVLEV